MGMLLKGLVYIFLKRRENTNRAKLYPARR